MFVGAHTAENLAKKIQEIIKRYLIENKVAYITSDSASNMVKGKKWSILLLVYVKMGGGAKRGLKAIILLGLIC